MKKIDTQRMKWINRKHNIKNTVFLYFEKSVISLMCTKFNEMTIFYHIIKELLTQTN